MVKEKDKKEYFKAFFQILILVLSTVAISYILHDAFDTGKIAETASGDDKVSYAGSILSFLNILNKIIWNEKNLVSAQELPQLQTCMKAKDGRACMGYLAEECAANCDGECVPSEPGTIAACEIGTCYDESQGSCAIGASRTDCESGGGKWFNDPSGNIPVCQRGCCVIGNEAMFATERECARASEILGLAKNFKPEIKTEASCLTSLEAEAYGACIVGKDSFGKNLCRFTTGNSCQLIKGEFHEGFLCSNPDLNTDCRQQARSGCVAGKDEIYWFDSCGNRENIYETNKQSSWNNGKVLTKRESCSLFSGSNPLGNQKTCGNCNYLAGSVCGNKTALERLDDNLQGSVCKKLSCTDENGKVRKHGESWCKYQSSIGLEDGRSADPPGSRHFRQVCWEGQVRLEPCQDYRNSICVQKDTAYEGRTFSSAACKLNAWQECLYYNTLDDREEATEDCSQNSECFTKNIWVDGNFHFNLCVPKYSPGFDLDTNPGGASAQCAMASQKCNVIYVKTVAHGWECKEGCHCEEPQFTEQMNDLCMSLGDCGAEVNYQGTLTENYNVERAPELSDAYLKGISKYNKPIPGKIADPGDVTALFSSIGIPDDLGNAGELKDTILENEYMQAMRNINGMIGTLAIALNSILPGGLAGALGGGVAGGAAGGATAAELSSTVGMIEGEIGATGAEAGSMAGGGAGGAVGGEAGGAAAAPAAGAAGAAIGAAIAYAAIYFAIEATGIGRGMPPALIMAMLTVGAVGGAFVGGAILAGTSVLATIPVIGWIILIVIAIAIIVMKSLGIGKSRERTVSFTCEPWEPVPGGQNCTSCGKDEFPCSKYTCQSLGKTCKFLDEGTGKEKCADVGKGDIAPPMISPGIGAISEGFQYADETELGVNIRSTKGDGCIPVYTPVVFGINLDKLGRCRYETVPEISYNDMTSDISLGLYQENHSIILNLPSPEGEGLPEYDPNKRADYNLYLRCQNANGYQNERDYVVSFCMKPGPDITPPQINLMQETRYAKYGAKEYNLSIFTNEPADCKWDSSDKEYGAMTNSWTCANGLGDQKLNGWECKTSLPITKDENIFYIRCADKPWKENIADRNLNKESRILKVVKTAKLEITSAGPNNETITSGVSPVSVKVSVTTAGGFDGTAKCSYSFDGERYIDFLSTLSSSHVQPLESFTSGKKRILLRCEDAAQNVAEKTIYFTIATDTTAPKITRIYSDAGGLFVRTDEPAQCALSKESCDFEFTNGTLMIGMGTEHTTTPDKNVIYYVKCKDPYGNAKGNCDLKIKVV